VKYRFISEHQREFRITTMCRVLRVARAGYYQWLQKPMSDRDIKDQRLLGLIRDSYAPAVACMGRAAYWVTCVKSARYAASTAWPRSCASKVSRPFVATRRRGASPVGPRSFRPTGDRQFTVSAPDRAWVTDITYLRTWQGWLYLAVVLDLYSRKVIGSAMKPSLGRG